MSFSSRPAAGRVWWTSPYLLLTLTSFFWSLNWVIGRAVVGTVPPVALAYYRWVLAMLILLPFSWPQLRRAWPAIRANKGVLVLLALTGTGYHNLVSYLGLNYTTATNGVMLNSSIPVLIIVLGVLFFGERVGLLQAIGVAVSLAGVATIVAQGHPETLLSMGFNVGDLIVLGSMLLWALYTLMLKWRPGDIPPLALLATCGLIGIVAMTPAFAWEVASGARVQWSWPVVGAIAYVGVFPSLVGYIFWNRGVQEVGPNVAGLFVHLMPMFGSLLSWQFLGERLHWFHLAGILLILGGIALTTRGAPGPALPAGEE